MLRVKRGIRFTEGTYTVSKCVVKYMVKAQKNKKRASIFHTVEARSPSPPRISILDPLLIKSNV